MRRRIPLFGIVFYSWLFSTTLVAASDSTERQFIPTTKEQAKDLGAEAAANRNYKKAILRMTQYLQECIQTNDDKGAGIALNELSGLYLNLGDYRSANKAAQQALEKNATPGHTQEEGKSLYHLGTSYYRLGDYGQSSKHLQQASKIIMQSGDEAWMVKVLNSIALTEVELGEYEPALEHFNRALQINRHLRNQPVEAKLLSNLGRIFSLQGNYSAALTNLSAAISIHKKLNDPDSVYICLINIGTILTNANQREEALRCYEEALGYVQRLGNKHLASLIFYNLGIIHNVLGNQTQALTYFQKSLKIETAAHSAQGIARTLYRLGYTYLKLNREAQALKFLNQALRLSKQIGHKYFIACCLTNLGKTYMAMGKSETALKYFQEALERGYRIHNLNIVWIARHGIGQCWENLGRFDEALNWYARAIETIDAVVHTLEDTFKISYFEDRIQPFESMIALLLRLDRTTEAFLYIEKAKARNLLEILGRGVQKIRFNLPERIEREKRQLERTIDSLHAELSTAYSKSPPEMKQISMIKLKLVHKSAAHETLLKEIQKMSPEFADLSGLDKRADIHDVQQQLLTDHAAFIEFFIAKDAIYVYVIKKTAFVVVKLNASVPEIKDLISRFREPLVDMKRNRLHNVFEIPFDLNILAQLYQKLFFPLEAYLSEICDVIIVPDGFLYYLPFEALITAESGRRVSGPVQASSNHKPAYLRFQSARYLIDRFAISYAASASTLVKILSRPPSPNKFKGELLALTNPANPSSSAQTFLSGGLPQAEKTTRALSRLFSNALILSGSAATKSQLFENGANYKIVHLATHGIIDESQPMYSKLRLAGVGEDEEGFLHTYEIFNRPLNAELTFIDACESGLGRLSRGEGLLGFTRAFMYAGSPSLGVTLWTIEDSSNALILEFYKNLKAGMKKSDALRHAKLWLIRSIAQKDPSKAYCSNPYFWAPFILIGDDRPIFPTSSRSDRAEPRGGTYLLLICPIVALGLWKIIKLSFRK